MPDREKVISGLECLLSPKKCDLRNCHYGNVSNCIDAILADALALLKEQEAKPVEVCGQMFTVEYGHCPTCGKGMDSDTYPRWCGFCGQAVKWE